jgi:anamorsin
MERTLLVAPPSLSSHEEKLNEVLEGRDRDATDLQMLDRLSLGLVSLPKETYDVILILTDADGSRKESQSLLGREVLAVLVTALKASGILKSQDGRFGASESTERTEAILAGLSHKADGGFVKLDHGGQTIVPLSFGKKKDLSRVSEQSNTGAGQSISDPSIGNQKSQEINGSTPAGVGFVNTPADLDQTEAADDSNDEIIDEDALMTEEDMKGPIKIRMHMVLYLDFDLC